LAVDSIRALESGDAKNMSARLRLRCCSRPSSARR